MLHIPEYPGSPSAGQGSSNKYLSKSGPGQAPLGGARQSSCSQGSYPGCRRQAGSKDVQALAAAAAEILKAVLTVGRAWVIWPLFHIEQFLNIKFQQLISLQHLLFVCF